MWFKTPFKVDTQALLELLGKQCYAGSTPRLDSSTLFVQNKHFSSKRNFDRKAISCCLFKTILVAFFETLIAFPVIIGSYYSIDMNRIRKIPITLRNHWKKSVFFSLVGVYGTSVINERIKVFNIMKSYCEEAAAFGNQPLRPTHPARHVTVILNPVSNKKKAKMSYEKYVYPLFSCAGLKVSLIQTESEGQSKELMEIMDNTDAVIIAGGSGTLHEAVTGLLRRRDGKNFALGVIPLGQLNRSSHAIHNFHSSSNSLLNQVKSTAEATLSVIRETKKKIDVLKVESEEKKKSVYAVDSLSFGSIQDMLSSCDSYWYLGNRMKPWLAFISQTLFRNINSFVLFPGVELKYTEPCKGCSTCRGSKSRMEEEVKPVQDPVSNNQSKRWWSPFVPRVPVTQTDTRVLEKTMNYDDIINEKCGHWKDVSESTSLINVIIENNPLSCEAKALLHKKNETSKGQLILDGVDARNGIIPSTQSQVAFKDLQIWLRESKQGMNHRDCLLIIDGEEYEMHDLKIERIPDKVTVYSPS